MFDKDKFDSIPRFNTFNYWFIRISDNQFQYGSRQSFLGVEPEINGILDEENDTSCPQDVRNEFDQFKLRPEYLVGKAAQIKNTSAADNDANYMVELYGDLIAGITFIRYLNARRDPDTAFDSIATVIDWLKSTDFYTCPGSTRFHDAEPCGLLFHSLVVYNNMLDLKHLQKFEPTPYHSIALIALSHDFTKIGNYEQYLRNVKDEATQRWEQVPAYRWKCNPFPFGHGVASMYIVSQFYHLSIEEMLAIRWHMGEYRVANAEGGELEAACEKYPLVRMIQFADQLACVNY